MLLQGVEATRHLELAWPCACPKWPKSLQRASEEPCSCRSFWFRLSLMPVFGQPRHRAPQLVSGSSGFQEAAPARYTTALSFWPSNLTLPTWLWCYKAGRHAPGAHQGSILARMLGNASLVFRSTPPTSPRFTGAWAQQTMD